MMKVLSVLGSPRKNSNSEVLANAAVAALPQAGLEVKTVKLNDLNFCGCQACFSCKAKSETCVVRDDLSPVLAQIPEADLVILASPIFIGELTGQAKCFIDRTFSFLMPDYTANPNPSRLSPGKKMLIILTQGVPDAAIYETSVLGNYTGFFKGLGFEVSHFIAPGQGPADDIRTKNPDLVKALTAQVSKLATN